MQCTDQRAVSVLQICNNPNAKNRSLGYLLITQEPNNAVL